MECKICNKETDVQFNFRGKLKPVCQKCATIIFKQQATFFALNKSIYDLPQTYKIASPRHPEIAAEILNFLNEKIKRKKRYTANDVNDVFLELISARVEEGHSLLKLKAVVHNRYLAWWNNPKMKEYLRPATLFNKEKFNSYVAEIPEDYNPDNSKEQRELIRQLNNLGATGQCNAETDKLAKELMKTGYTKKQFLNMYLINKI